MMFPLYSHKTTNSLGLVEPADMLWPCLALFGLPLRKDHLTLHSTAAQHRSTAPQGVEDSRYLEKTVMKKLYIYMIIYVVYNIRDQMMRVYIYRAIQYT